MTQTPADTCTAAQLAAAHQHQHDWLTGQQQCFAQPEHCAEDSRHAGLPANGTIAAEVAFMFNDWCAHCCTVCSVTLRMHLTARLL